MSRFYSPNIFGQTPRPPDGNIYFPQGYGVPNPVHESFSTGLGGLLQCERKWAINDLLTNIWRTYKRDLTIQGRLVAPAQDNFTPNPDPETFLVLPRVENPPVPTPALPFPFQANTPSIPMGLVWPDLEQRKVAGRIQIGTLDEAILIEDSSTVANLPVYADIYARWVLEFYPWYLDAGSSRSWYSFVSMQITVQAYWDEAYSAEPSPNIGFGDWYTERTHDQMHAAASMAQGELWGCGAPGTTTVNTDGASKLGVFGLFESDITFPNTIEWDFVRIIATSMYPARKL